jgi:hypothetical protein
MGKIDLKTFADSCGVSVLELGHVFGSIGLGLDFKDKNFEGEALWEILKKLDTKPKIKMPTPNAKETYAEKIIKSNKRNVCVELRRKALDLFTVNNFNAGWIPLVGNRLFTALRITSTTGKYIDVSIGAAMAGHNSFNFTVSAPFNPWYCLILKSMMHVHLRRKDDFLSIKYWDTKKSAACLNTNTNQTNFLFQNQIEDFRAELESL